MNEKNNAIKKNIYFENLNGLRFICFLSVFFYHSFHSDLSEIRSNYFYHFIRKDIFGNGNLGVNFFFVLSGFLITFLLIEEKKLNTQINIKNFWFRRILRIWPLYFLCVIFGFWIYPHLLMLFGQVPKETANPIAYLTFINNFDLIKKGLPEAPNLSVLWSVAIEEQFYLVWPIIIFLFPIKRLWVPFSVILISSSIFRAFNDNYMDHEHHTLSCIGDMTMGAVGAWLITISSKFKKGIETMTKNHILIIYCFFIFIFFFRDEVFYEYFVMRIFERMIISSIIILIILEQTFSINSFFKMKTFKKISNLGTITYGLYCLHYLGILIITTIAKKLSLNVHLWQVIFIIPSLSLLLTIIISKLSYKYFETPFLKFKKRFSIFKMESEVNKPDSFSI